MKKLKNLFFVGISFLIVTTLFTSCSKDDDGIGGSGSLVGIWDCTSYVEYYEGKGENMNTSGIYVEFTKDEMRYHDPEDIVNNVWMDYSYNKSSKVIKVGGFGVWNVEQLTSSTLKIRTAEVMTSYSVMTFKKR